METILSAKLMAVEEPIDKSPDYDPPEIIEVVTEKVITETRTYDKAFLLSQREAILRQKQEQMDARDKELAQIDELLKEFERLVKG